MVVFDRLGPAIKIAVEQDKQEELKKSTRVEHREFFGQADIKIQQEQ